MARKKTLSVWMRDRREMAGLSQAVAAAAVGVHRVTWMAWESGDAHPVKIAHIRALAAWGGILDSAVLGMIP